MYYQPNPRWFHPAEFFPKSASIHFGQNHLWRLMDQRILWTCEELRKRYGIMVINDYAWGGNNQYRAYRPVNEIIDKEHFFMTGEFKASFSSFTSQHCFGQAIDCKFYKVGAEEIRQDIKRNPDNEAFKHITRIENNVDWLHFDCASWNREKYGILFFNP